MIGDYADAGVMLGRVSGSCLAGVFTNGDRSGRFRFERTDEGRFEGDWAWHGDSLDNDWNGRRAGDAENSLDNFVSPDGKSLQTLDNDRDVFDGVYDSPFGKVALMQQDLFLIGDYSDKGIIAGLWDGNSFRGYFTNDGRTGWFDFAFLSKNGDFQSGEWNWVGNDSGRDWALSEVSGRTPDIDNMTQNVSCGG